jgi:hypothetical protein
MTPPDPARRARLTGAALLAGVFLAGALAGGAAVRVLDRRPPPGEGHGRGGRLPPALEALHPTADQRARIHAILRASKPRIDAVVREMLPRLRAVTDSVEMEIRTVLTESQRAQLARSLRPGQPLMAPLGTPPRPGERRPGGGPGHMGPPGPPGGGPLPGGEGPPPA